MRRLVAALLLGLFAAVAVPALAETFEEIVARIDAALEDPPPGVTEESLKSCRSMRNTAVKLYRMGMAARAERRLRMCLKLLRLE